MTKTLLVLARGVLADALDLGSALLARGAAVARAPEEEREPTHVREVDEELGKAPTVPAPPPVVDPLTPAARAMLDVESRARPAPPAGPLPGSIGARASSVRAWR